MRVETGSPILTPKSLFWLEMKHAFNETSLGKGKKWKSEREDEKQNIKTYWNIWKLQGQKEISYNRWIVIRSSMNTMSVWQLDILSYIMNTSLNNVSEFGMLML